MGPGPLILSSIARCPYHSKHSATERVVSKPEALLVVFNPVTVLRAPSLPLCCGFPGFCGYTLSSIGMRESAGTRFRDARVINTLNPVT